MTATTTTFAPALKTLWPTGRYLNAVYKDNPLLALLPKMERFVGKNLVLPVRYTDQQGRSSVFATAQANKSATAGKDFTLTRAKDYAVGSIETELILAGEEDPGSLASALDTESDGLMNAIVRSLAIKLYGDGSGAIGRAAASGGVSSNTVTLSNPEDISNFEVGMKIQANPNKTGNSGSMRSGTGTITSIDRNAGTFTCSGGLPTSTANDDYFYVHGDYDAPIKGLAAWVPTSAPSSTSFFGVDRTPDVTRLGGQRHDISSLSPEEGFVKALFLMDRERSRPDYAFANPSDIINVQHALGSKVVYDQLSVGGIGFRAIEVHGPKKTCKLMSDMNCPKGYSWALEMQYWKLYSLGKAPRILNVDGQEILREYNADSNEIRMAYYAQLGCEFPGSAAVLTLPT